MPLAIVGIGCHFPGGAHTPESYWDLLCSETDATRTVPDAMSTFHNYSMEWTADRIRKLEKIAALVRSPAAALTG